LRWFGIPACTANPEGHTSITGTARFARMIFYITLTLPSGHTADGSLSSSRIGLDSHTFRSSGVRVGSGST
jgi:hypothetical protein